VLGACELETRLKRADVLRVPEGVTWWFHRSSSIEAVDLKQWQPSHLLPPQLEDPVLPTCSTAQHSTQLKLGLTNLLGTAANAATSKRPSIIFN
jgi:hypothetical protein